jgi:ubiquitin C-terminal hydrolase
VVNFVIMLFLQLGLKNQGCTSCINSVLQQIYAISEYRSAILRCNVSQGDGITEDNDQGTYTRRRNERETSEAKQALIFQTKHTFQKLNNPMGRAFVDPAWLVQAFVDLNPAFKTNQHNCAHEFLHLFLDQIETQMEALPASKSYTNQLPDCIGGVIETVKTCTVCQQHTTVVMTPFKSLCVNIRSTDSETPCKTVDECIQEYMKSKTLQESSQVECSHCKRERETILTRKVSMLQQVAF